MKRIAEGAWLLALGNANAVLLEGGGELALVDAGFPDKEGIVFDALRGLGRGPRDLKHLVFTHHHLDHVGSAAAIVRETGATTWMGAADVAIAETGGPFRPMARAPGLLARVLYPLFWRPGARVAPVRIDHAVVDGETLPVAGGLQAVAAPGHCAGQLAFLWQGSRLLLAGDAWQNMVGLGDPIGFEDLQAGRRSQRRLASLDFEAAAFGHGRPIVSGAAARVRRSVA